MGGVFKSNRLTNLFLVNIEITMTEEIEGVREVVIEVVIEVETEVEREEEEIEVETEVEREEEIEAEDRHLADLTIIDHP